MIKIWSTSIAVPTLEQEVEWLKCDASGKRPFQLELERLNAFSRFSARKGEVETVKY